MSLVDNITTWIDDTWEKTCEVAKALPELGTIVREETRTLGIDLTDAICDEVGCCTKPIPGSVIRCKIAGGITYHSGIYIGNNRIVELEGEGHIRTVSTYEFLSHPGPRTGFSSQVACDDAGNPLGSERVASRARAKIGDRVEYNLVTENCHKFTTGCLTGDFENDITLFTELEEIIKNTFGVLSIQWKRI